SLKDGGDQLSNFCDSSRTAASLPASISARMCSTVSRTLASAALIAVASIPRLRYRAITNSPVFSYPPWKGEGDFHLIPCGLIGEPVPPLMIKGGPQKKNS